MKSMMELEDYIRKTEDNTLSMIVEVVKEFGNRLPGLINELKQNHTATKEEADMIFSTVHRCKGMEYDQVSLLNDFITEEKLKKNISEKKENKLNTAEKNRLAEEVNILYVAATRTKKKLVIPAEINPLKSIELAPSALPLMNYRNRTYNKDYLNSQDHFDWKPEKPSFSEMRRLNHGKKWTKEEEAQLEHLFKENISIADIAKVLARGEHSIKMKLASLGFEPERE